MAFINVTPTKLSHHIKLHDKEHYFMSCYAVVRGSMHGQIKCVRAVSLMDRCLVRRKVCLTGEQKHFLIPKESAVAPKALPVLRELRKAMNNLTVKAAGLRVKI
jgi:hypothetical protein